MNTKYCSKCKETKPISEFYKDRRGGCKKCVRAYQNKWHLEHRILKRVPEIIPDGYRRCSVCKQLKEVCCFYKDSHNVSGYHHQCKICSDKKSSERKKLKRAIIREATVEKLPDGMKRCRKCNNIYPVSEFRKTKVGYTSPCRTCLKKYKKDNKDKILERSRKLRQQPEVKEKRNKTKREKRKNDPEYIAKERAYAYEYNRRDYVKDKARKANAQFRLKQGAKEDARKRTIEWRKSHPELVRIQVKIKRARKMGAAGSYTYNQWQKLLSLCDNKCLKCNGVDSIEADHIIPLSKGGTNDIGNIQPLCKSCNCSKHNSHNTDYRPEAVKQWAESQRKELENE